MTINLRLIHLDAGSAGRPLRRAACLCVLPLALVPLLRRAARHGIIVSAAPPAVDAPRSLGSAPGPGDCEQYRRAYRICLVEGSAGAVLDRGESEGPAISPQRLPGADGLLPSCDELRAGARRMLVSTTCKL